MMAGFSCIRFAAMAYFCWTVLLASSSPSAAAASGHPSVPRRLHGFSNYFGSIHREQAHRTMMPLGVLRGGSDEIEKESKSNDVAEEDVKQSEEELSVESTDEEESPGALDGDAVDISADAFINPSHVGEDVDNETEEEETFYSAVEDEDEGSTTPVTPDDEDLAPADADIAVVADDANPSDIVEASIDEPIDGVEEAEDEVDAEQSGPDVAVGKGEPTAQAEPEVAVAVEEPTVADDAEETDYTRQQAGGYYTDDDSAAFVDRMDLADDEGEVLDTAVVTEEDIDAAVDPLDLGLAESSREALQRQQQATVAAASEAAAVATAEDAPPSVQYMITRKMKQVLADELGYTIEEVDNMKPDVAAVITSKRLKRPSGGMPDAFYVDGKAPSASKNRFGRLWKNRIVQKVVIPALVVGSTAYIAALTFQPAMKEKTSSRGRSSSAPAVAIPALTEDRNPGAGIASTAESYKPIKKDELKKSSEEEEIDESGLASYRLGKGNLPKDLEDTWLDKLVLGLLEKLSFRSR